MHKSVVGRDACPYIRVQGRNRLVEVKCQSLIPVEPILDILLRPSDDVPYTVKTPFLRFFHEVPSPPVQALMLMLSGVCRSTSTLHQSLRTIRSKTSTSCR